MSSSNIDTNTGNQNNKILKSSVNYMAHEHEPADRYEEYLAHGVQSKNQLSDSRNFFDDSNREDRHWVKVAKRFLSKAG